MIEYWYCGNIPPRPLDDKRKILKFEGKIKDKTKFGPIRAAFVKKKQFFEKTRQNVKAGSHNQR
jgi:hypothetical protein